MRCRLCKEVSVYKELGFCKDHFINYFETKVKKYLANSRLRGTKVLVGVSGGKDSAALAYTLSLFKEEFDYEMSLFTINLRIGEYSSKSLRASQALAELLGEELVVVDLDEFPKQIPVFVGGRDSKPCSQCGTIKRYLLNKNAIDYGCSFVATGHNLDDEHFFMVRSLEQGNLVQLLRSDKRLPPKKEQKMVGRIKPLYELTEKESMIYCLLKELPVHLDDCPFSVGNPQIAFKEQGVSRHAKLNTIKTLRKLKKGYDTQEYDDQVVMCGRCGYPTTKRVCLFCRVMND